MNLSMDTSCNVPGPYDAGAEYLSQVPIPSTKYQYLHIKERRVSRPEVADTRHMT